MKKYIYIGYYRLDIEKGKLIINKSKQPYEKSEFNEYLLNVPVFINKIYSTYRLDNIYLDKELNIDGLMVIYSTDERKIDEWIANKKIEFKKTVNKMVDMLKKLEVEQ